MQEQIVARNNAEYNIWRANTRMVAASNAQISDMSEKAGLGPLEPAPSTKQNIVVANNLAETGLYRLDKAMDDSALRIAEVTRQIGQIFQAYA